MNKQISGQINLFDIFKEEPKESPVLLNPGQIVYLVVRGDIEPYKVSDRSWDIQGTNTGYDLFNIESNTNSNVTWNVNINKDTFTDKDSATLINARFAMPFDKEAIKELPAEHSLLVTMEENVQSGGFGEHVTEYVKTNGIALEVLTVALPDCYVEHGNVEVLKKELHVDAESVAKRIIAAL